MDEKFVFDAAGARRIINAVRLIENIFRGGPGVSGPPRANTRPAVPIYRKTWYRIVSNDDNGEYTLRKREWNATSKQLQDVSDTEDPDYGVDLTGYDFEGRDDGRANREVEGWKLYIDGAWVLLVAIRGLPYGDANGQMPYWDEQSGGFWKIMTDDLSAYAGAVPVWDGENQKYVALEAPKGPSAYYLLVWGSDGEDGGSFFWQGYDELPS